MVDSLGQRTRFVDGAPEVRERVPVQPAAHGCTASIVTPRSSHPFAETVTVIVPASVGRTTASARPLYVSCVADPKVSSVQGLPLPRPWSLAGPSTATVTARSSL